MADTKTWWLDADNAIPKVGMLPAKANTIYEGGRIAWSDGSGYAIPSSSATATSKAWGIYLNRVDNSTGTTVPGNSGLNNGVPTGVPYQQGYALCLGDGSVTAANVGQYVYLVSDSGTGKPTVGLSDAGGTRPLVGFVSPYVRTSSDVDPSAIPVAVGFSRPDALDPELTPGGSTAFKARLVVTSLSASYTGSGTGTLTGPASTAWPTQDGITNANQAVGDVVFIQEGTTNLADPKDAGPWVIANLAASSGSWSLTRPDWWANGATIVQGQVIQVGGDGTGTTPQFAGSEWKTFAAKGKVIGTDAPAFWPRRLAGTYTASSGVVVNAISTIAIRSTTTSQAVATNQGTAANASTVGPPRVTAITAGVVGTAALTMKAESAPGTTNASDVGVYTVSVTNW